MRCKLTKCNTQNLMAREFCVAPLPARVAKDILRQSKEFDFNLLRERRVATGVTHDQSVSVSGSGNVGISTAYGAKEYGVHANLRKLERMGADGLIRSLNALVRKTFPDFKFTNIQMNKNFPGKLHIDRGNIGKSIMLVVADPGATGGDLFVRLPANKHRDAPHSCVLEVMNKWVWFDGTIPHATMATKGGERYSFVFFTSNNVRYKPLSPQVTRSLRDFQFAPPARPLALRWNKKRQEKNTESVRNLEATRDTERATRREYERRVHGGRGRARGSRVKPTK